MKIYLIPILLLTALVSNAQNERKFIRKGNHDFKKNDFVESEIQYRNALKQNSHSLKGQFNLADALYKQEKYDESLETLSNLNLTGLTNTQKASVLYNKGNALFKQNKLKESIEAYKSALKFNPNDKEAKYNLSEAIRLLQQQQNSNNKNQQDNNNSNNKDKDKQNQNQNKQDNGNNDKNNTPDNNNSQGENQQQPKLSKEDAERILEAIQNHEMQIQDRLKDEKAKQAKVRVGKNW